MNHVPFVQLSELESEHTYFSTSAPLQEPCLDPMTRVTAKNTVWGTAVKLTQSPLHMPKLHTVAVH